MKEKRNVPKRDGNPMDANNEASPPLTVRQFFAEMRQPYSRRAVKVMTLLLVGLAGNARAEDWLDRVLFGGCRGRRSPSLPPPRFLRRDVLRLAELLIEGGEGCCHSAAQTIIHGLSRYSTSHLLGLTTIGEFCKRRWLPPISAADQTLPSFLSDVVSGWDEGRRRPRDVYPVWLLEAMTLIYEEWALWDERGPIAPINGPHESGLVTIPYYAD